MTPSAPSSEAGRGFLLALKALKSAEKRGIYAIDDVAEAVPGWQLALRDVFERP
jgi:hypothetical protein